MARQIPQEALEAIEEAVRRNPEGMTTQQLVDALQPTPKRRTLQFRLKSLVDSGRLIRQGDGRQAKYVAPPPAESKPVVGGNRDSRAISGGPKLSAAGAEIQAYISKPLTARTPVGYNGAFLETYRPGETYYLTPDQREYLRERGTPKMAAQPAGTYARQILNRLLIDLSWNSSRLEGNTYSLLDTRRLIQFGEEADGKQRLEAQMILNHKDAIEFLVETAGERRFDRITILNLHALLANNLIADPAAVGRLRYISVGISGSVFHPLDVPQLIEQRFDQILATVSAIPDPFEQAFFVLVHLPYLQPFDDVNKRVSRLAANISLIQGNYAPLSFEDLPREAYTEAVLGVYELNRIELFRDVFVWAYDRSAARYTAVRQSLGEPDPFRLKHRDSLRELVGELIRQRLPRQQAREHVRRWTEVNIASADRSPFMQAAEQELIGLHEGNFARYHVTPAQFAAWQAAWNR